MAELTTIVAEREELARRRVPCVLTYLSPFRMVVTPGWQWDATLEQINIRDWDYVRLHEMAGGLDVDLPPPYHLAVARDGALALPPIEGLRSDRDAVAFFNRCLAALLLGGIYCEAISPDGIEIGSIIDWKYIRASGTGLAAENRFHHHVRYRSSAPLEAINLLNPRTVSLVELQAALGTGLAILNQVGRMRGDILLKGITGIARRDWNAGLSNLWIIVEQLLSHLWEKEVLEPTAADGSSKARREQLRDNRTWTASTRLEVLHQKGVIDLASLALLSTARKARNDLSHEGDDPTEEASQAAYGGVRALLSAAVPNLSIPLFQLDLGNHALSDPFAPRALAGEPQLWMEIPKLPGELELEQREAKLHEQDWQKKKRRRTKAK